MPNRKIIRIRLILFIQLLRFVSLTNIFYHFHFGKIMYNIDESHKFHWIFLRYLFLEFFPLKLGSYCVRFISPLVPSKTWKCVREKTNFIYVRNENVDESNDLNFCAARFFHFVLPHICVSIYVNTCENY